jgi:hypothetical protein
VIDRIAARAREASPVWGAVVAPSCAGAAVYGHLVDERFGFGLEMIYEGYLVHHGASRAFLPPDREQAILLGDFLSAAGLVDICRAGDLDAVGTLASLIADVSDLRARGAGDDGSRWLEAVAALR